MGRKNSDGARRHGENQIVVSLKRGEFSSLETRDLLVIVVILGFIVSVITLAVARRLSRRHTLDRQVIDSEGNSESVHEETQ